MGARRCGRLRTAGGALRGGPRPRCLLRAVAAGGLAVSVVDLRVGLVPASFVYPALGWWPSAFSRRRSTSTATGGRSPTRPSAVRSRSRFLRCSGGSSPGAWGSATCGWPAWSVSALGWLGLLQLYVGFIAAFLIGVGRRCGPHGGAGVPAARRASPFGPAWPLGAPWWGSCGGTPSWPPRASRRPERTSGSLEGVLRFLTAGESHGQALVVIVEGCPPACPSRPRTSAPSWPAAASATAGARACASRPTRSPCIGGIRHGRTLGSPVAIEIANTEWPKWTEEMSPAPGAPDQGPDPAPAGPRRPGRHAEVRLRRRPRRARAGLGPRDRGPGGGRGPGQGSCSASSASSCSATSSSSAASASPSGRAARTRRTSTRSTSRRCAASTPRPRRGWSPRSRRRPRTATRSAASPRSSPTACRSASGSHVHWDRKLDGLLAQALMSIQAVKAVEIGEGFDVAGRRGSEAHDAIYVRRADRPAATGATPRGPAASRAACRSAAWSSARVAMKPLATLNRPVLETVDVVTKESTVSFKERTDVTAVPAMGVVAETMMALVLASEALRKFGGDSLAEVLRNRDGFVRLPRRDALGRSPAARDDAPPSARHVGEADRVVAGRDDGRRQDDRRPAAWPTASAGPTSTPTPRSRRPPAASVAEIFATDGEAGLPGRRDQAAARARARRLGPVVVSVAGGAVLDPDNRAAARRPRAPWCGCGPRSTPWPQRVGRRRRAGRCSAATRPATLRPARRRAPPALRTRWPTPSSTSTSCDPRRRSADRALVDLAMTARDHRRGRARRAPLRRASSATGRATSWPRLAAERRRRRRAAVVVTQASLADAGWFDDLDPGVPVDGAS